MDLGLQLRRAVRLHQGDQGNYYVNPYFAGDAANATAASVVVGAYDFADYTVSPTTEASYYLNTAGSYVGAGFLRPMIDVEASTSDTASQVSTWVNTWCNAVYQATGVKPIVYTYISYAQTYLNSTVTQWPLWMANYNGQNSQTGGPSSTSPWSSWNIWQYSSSGSVNGISGSVDMDVANGDMTSYVIPQLVGGSTQFTKGEAVHVTATTGLKAWNTYASNGTYVVEPTNTNGVIEGSPVYINGYLRWPIQYAGSSSTTWSAGAFLAQGGVPTITNLSGLPNPVTSGSNVTLTATVSDPSSTIASVAFYRESNGTTGLQTGSGGDTLLGTDTNSAGGWSISTSTSGLTGTFTYYAVATDTGGPTSATASTTVTINSTPPPPPPPASATYVKADDATEGTWSGVYGSDGYDVIGGAASLPAYAQLGLEPGGGQPYVWDAAAAADPRAAQASAGSSSRVAACDYSGSGFTFDLSLTDGRAHQVGIYLLDWDNAGRAETVTVSDAAAGGAVLDARAVTGFAGGRWLVWDLSGSVRVTIANDGAVNAVASAFAFDPVAAASPPAAATFAGADAATQGTWAGAYGSDGYRVMGGASSLPAYATLAAVNAQSWTWAAAGSTADPRAPLAAPAPGSSRVAAADYAAGGSGGGGGFSLDLGLTDGRAHRVAVYLLDWDDAGRAETVTVSDAATGAVLDAQSVTGFAGGRWLSWTVSGGHVRLTFAATAGPNAVLSAVAFDPAPAASTSPGSAAFLAADAATQGTWAGAYGSDGYRVAGGASSLPAYATLAASPDTQSWTWVPAGGTSDPRAPLAAPAPGSSRVAAADYAGGGSGGFSYDLDLTDGKAHRVALYLLDWDNAGRAETVTVSDAATGAVLDTRPAGNFAGGVYLAWTLAGHVKLTIANTAGPNAVASGVFFG